MKWSFATVGVIMLGILGVAIIMIFTRVTTSNESDYYMLKEVTEAAMIDAIDIQHYRNNNGELKINKEKFVENFTRRFAESTTIAVTEYVIEFYSIIETPPKVSVVIKTKANDNGIVKYTTDYNVVNNLTAILEYITESTTKEIKKGDNPYTSTTWEPILPNYYIAKNTDKVALSIRLPDLLANKKINNVKINSIKFNSLSNVANYALYRAIMSQELYYDNVSLDDKFYTLSNQDIKGASESDIDILYYCNCDVEEKICTGNQECSSIIPDKSKPYWVIIKPKSIPRNKYELISYKIVWEYDEYDYYIEENGEADGEAES